MEKGKVSYSTPLIDNFLTKPYKGKKTKTDKIDEKLFEQFRLKLQSNDYFQGNIQGSAMYNKLLANAREFYSDTNDTNESNESYRRQVTNCTNFTEIQSYRGKFASR